MVKKVVVLNEGIPSICSFVDGKIHYWSGTEVGFTIWATNRCTQEGIPPGEEEMEFTEEYVGGPVSWIDFFFPVDNITEKELRMVEEVVTDPSPHFSKPL